MPFGGRRDRAVVDDPAGTAIMDHFNRAAGRHRDHRHSDAWASIKTFGEPSKTDDRNNTFIANRLS